MIGWCVSLPLLKNVPSTSCIWTPRQPVKKSNQVIQHFSLSSFLEAGVYTPYVHIYRGWSDGHILLATVQLQFLRPTMQPLSVLISCCLVFGIGGAPATTPPIEEDPCFFVYQHLVDVRILRIQYSRFLECDAI